MTPELRFKVKTELVSILVILLVVAVAVVFGAYLPLWLALILAPVVGVVAVGTTGTWLKRQATRFITSR